jgi:hypothetical protein
MAEWRRSVERHPFGAIRQSVACYKIPWRGGLLGRLWKQHRADAPGALGTAVVAINTTMVVSVIAG